MSDAYDEELRRKSQAILDALIAEKDASESPPPPPGQPVPPEPPDIEEQKKAARARIKAIVAAEEAEREEIRRKNRAEREQAQQAPPAMAPTPMPPAQAPPAPLPAAAPAPQAGNIDETAYSVQRVPGLGLPFESDAPVKAPAPADLPEHEQVGETAFLPRIEGLDVPPDGGAIPELSVEQYASLCVERKLYPDRVAAIRARYQANSDEALRALDDRWRQRFGQDMNLQQHWQTAYTQYEQWLRTKK